MPDDPKLDMESIENVGKFIWHIYMYVATAIEKQILVSQARTHCQEAFGPTCSFVALLKILFVAM